MQQSVRGCRLLLSVATTNTPKSIGKYEILSVLGRGGMGVVYKARDPHIDRTVAIKTILTSQDGEQDEDLLSRLRLEARSAGRLHHPNIVTIFDFGEQDELAYIVMEFVEGINLARVIEEKRPLELGTKVDIILQIASGLGFAHDQGVIHRDMKPANICVTATGTAKILDFGLARLDDTKLTKTGFVSGTIAYMSPERFSGITGIQDDVFALGAIAYELIAYRRAFPGSAPPEIIGRIIAPEGPPKPSTLTDLPPGVDEVILKALAREVGNRYQSAAAFARDLRAMTHTPAYLEFVNDPERIRAIEMQVAQFAELHEKAGNPYSPPSSSRRSVADTVVPTLTSNPALSDYSTRRGDTTAIKPSSQTFTTQPDATMVVQDSSGSATVIMDNSQGALPTTVNRSAAESAPTQVVPTTPRSRNTLYGGILAVVALLIVIAVVMRKDEVPTSANTSTPNPAPSLPATTHTSTTAALDPRLIESGQLQLATARSLAEELSKRPLTSEQRLRLTEANARASLAEQKLRERDYEAASRLASDAVSGMRELITSARETTAQTSTSSPAKILVEATRPEKVTRVPPTNVRPTPSPVAPPPTPVPVAVVPTPVPVNPEPQPPRPTPAPVVTPARPTENPEKEVTAFVRDLARAYQNKDVAFFREHALQYSDAFANAIRNSPSVRVDMQVTRVEVTDANHATAWVRRTDTFADSSVPPAVQSLVYRLQRSGAEWKLASIGRQ